MSRLHNMIIIYGLIQKAGAKMTEEQIKVLEQCLDGANYYDLGREIVDYLLRLHLCEMPRLNPPVVYTTQKGKAVLSDFRHKQANKKQEESEKQRTEAKRLKERHEDKADDERRYRTQNKIAIIMPILTFFLGLIVEHFSGIVEIVLSLFKDS